MTTEDKDTIEPSTVTVDDLLKQERSDIGRSEASTVTIDDLVAKAKGKSKRDMEAAIKGGIGMILSNHEKLAVKRQVKKGLPSEGKPGAKSDEETYGKGFDPSKKALTEKQQKFVTYVLMGHNYTDAYARMRGIDPVKERSKMGKYFGQSASEMAAIPQVKAALERARQRKKEIVLQELDEGTVIQAGLQRSDIATELVKIAYNPDGKDNDRINALKLIGQITGALKETGDIQDAHKQVFRDGFKDPLSALNHYLGVLSDKFLRSDSVDVFVDGELIEGGVAEPEDVEHLTTNAQTSLAD
jgi:hypothetical protein